MFHFSFAILKHTRRQDQHWDWMLTDPSAPEGRLITFRSRQFALYDFEVPHFFELRPLPLHRRIYLTYQGAISNQRGWVNRIDGGAMQVRKFATMELVFSLEGQKLNGVLVIQCQSAFMYKAAFYPKFEGN